MNESKTAAPAAVFFLYLAKNTRYSTIRYKFQEIIVVVVHEY